MPDVQRFTITPEHVTLAKQVWIGWDDCEFGAPAIDCKRPYGNSDVLGDMRELLRRPDAPDDDLYELHKSMQTFLQIVLRTGQMEPGDYEAPKYGIDWRRVDSDPLAGKRP